MEKLKKQIAILNLAGELSSELTDYFASRGIEVHVPSDGSEQDWTHIITRDMHEFDQLNTVYDLIEKDRFLISLSKVTDLKNFTINNGNLVLDDCWFSTELGHFIMDKYLQGYGGISLSDNYPTFVESGSFNVANPFNTGEYLDRMVQKAYENGSEALSVKTYFDHLVMYIAGLKNKGKAGLPLEVTYGNFNDIFGVQIHFFAQHLDILDFTTSLSSSISKRADEYFLNVAVQAADFFDFSYLPEVNKVIITGLWTKDERIKFENRGFMFTTIQGGAPLVQYQMEGATTSLVVSDSSIPDFTDQLTVISSSVKEEESVQVVAGSPADSDDVTQTISGTTDVEEVSQVIAGSEEIEDLVQTIKGKLEEDKSIFKVAGQKLDIDKTAFRIASTVDDSTKDKNMSVKSLGSNLQKNIKSGLYEFAKSQGKDVEDLEADDLHIFQSEKVPDILKKELEQTVVIKSSEEKANNNPMAIKSLGGKAPEASTPEETKELYNKLISANAENEKLRSQLKTVASEVRILKDSRNKLAELQAKAQAASVEINLKQNENTVIDNEHNDLMNKIHQKLDDQDAQKISVLLDNVKQEELKVRKLQLEALQKDTFFSQQLEKSERDIKSKDLILIKTKETFTKLVDKKDREVSELKSKIEQLSKALVSSPSSNQQQIMKDLEKQNQNLNKQIEMYKIKITSMASNLQPSKSEDTLKDEARKLQMLNQQMKNQLDQTKRELEKFQSKASADNSQILTLKQAKAKLEQQLKKASMETKEVTANAQNAQNDQELRRLQAQNQILETQVKDSAQKISSLETKLVEALKPQRPGNNGEEASTVKVTQLENSVKKLTQDLIAAKNLIAESKKETNKLRQDKTALQNQLDKLKKEADKAKSAAPKKPGGKAA